MVRAFEEAMGAMADGRIPAPNEQTGAPPPATELADAPRSNLPPKPRAALPGPVAVSCVRASWGVTDAGVARH